jgi:hypothetical protein
MARPKKIEKESLPSEEKAKIARELRMRKAGVTKEQIEQNVREEFRLFFIRIKKSLGISSNLEEIIWLHFKSCGFDRPEKFEDGIKHFGYRI